MPWLIRAGRLRNLAGRRQGKNASGMAMVLLALFQFQGGELVEEALVGYAGCGLMTLMRGSRFN